MRDGTNFWGGFAEEEKWKKKFIKTIKCKEKQFFAGFDV